MRTKTLLLTAALGAAGIASSMAQAVYSVNIVGYINVSVPTGFSLLANQLNASPDNKLTTVLPTPPDGTFVYKFVAATGGYTIDDYIGGWEGDDLNMTLGPGEGVFIQAPSAFTATFVGEVKTGTVNVPVKPGFSVVSSAIPQAGKLQADLGYTPVDGDFFYQFNPATGGYIVNDYIGGWEGDTGEPNIGIAEAFFVQAGSTDVNRQWSRVFNVGP